MNERMQATLIMAFLPAAAVLFFAPELHDAGRLPLGAAIGTAISVIVGAFTWRGSRVLSEDK